MEVLLNPKTLLKRDSWLSRAYYTVCGWLKYKIFSKDHRDLVKTSFSSCPWDFSCLYDVEFAKIKEMANYLEKSDRFNGVEYVVRDMRMCLSEELNIIKSITFTTRFLLQVSSER